MVLWSKTPANRKTGIAQRLTGLVEDEKLKFKRCPDPESQVTGPAHLAAQQLTRREASGGSAVVGDQQHRVVFIRVWTTGPGVYGHSFADKRSWVIDHLAAVPPRQNVYKGAALTKHCLETFDADPPLTKVGIDIENTDVCDDPLFRAQCDDQLG